MVVFCHFMVEFTHRKLGGISTSRTSAHKSTAVAASFRTWPD